VISTDATSEISTVVVAGAIGAGVSRLVVSILVLKDSEEVDLAEHNVAFTIEIDVVAGFGREEHARAHTDEVIEQRPVLCTRAVPNGDHPAFDFGWEFTGHDDTRGRGVGAGAGRDEAAVFEGA